MENNGVAAKIEITLATDGQVTCKVNSPSPLLTLGLLEFAKTSAVKQMTPKEQAITLPPLGMQVPRA